MSAHPRVTRFLWVTSSLALALSLSLWVLHHRPEWQTDLADKYSVPLGYFDSQSSGRAHARAEYKKNGHLYYVVDGLYSDEGLSWLKDLGVTFIPRGCVVRSEGREFWKGHNAEVVILARHGHVNLS